jgi:hypothetical protein
VNLLWPSNLTRSVAREPVRHHDIFMIYRSHLDLSARLEIPPDVAVRTLPEPVSIDNQFIRFKLQCQREGTSAVACRRILTIKARTIGLDHYPGFRDACRKIDASEAQDIVLVKKP